MARKAEATLWMLLKIGERSVMKRVVKKGRGYVMPRVKGPYEPGSYYLCYTRNGSRAWESVRSSLTRQILAKCRSLSKLLRLCTMHSSSAC